ncbi:hypothetical protein BMS3Abin04_00300 [bacterium BMS3Abin04]|nr:hypothetical protein BMS3Abin04_00300 [bacterium BMS3Abin04]
MKTIDQVLQEKEGGLYYGNRILLPFEVHILKAIIENDIITDFSASSDDAEYTIYDDFTEIYFYNYKDVSSDVTKYETIKLIIVEEDKYLFNTKNHRKIALHVQEKHHLKIEELGDDIILID